MDIFLSIKVALMFYKIAALPLQKNVSMTARICQHCLKEVIRFFPAFPKRNMYHREGLKCIHRNHVQNCPGALSSSYGPHLVQIMALQALSFVQDFVFPGLYRLD